MKRRKRLAWILLAAMLTVAFPTAAFAEEDVPKGRTGREGRF